MRYEVDVRVEFRHLLAVEAEDTLEAQSRALDLIGSGRTAEELTTTFHIEAGVSPVQGGGNGGEG